jgi:hypothetical protein
MTAELRCAGCGLAYCTQHVRPDGRRIIDVHLDLVMRAVDVTRRVFDITCPGCGRAGRVRLALDPLQEPRRFRQRRRPRKSRGARGNAIPSALPSLSRL